MGTELRPPLTRREMLVAGFGGLVGVVAGVLGRPAEALGADGAPVLIGRSNSGSHATTMTAPGDPALKCVSSGHDGLWGQTKVGNRSGVYGWTGVPDGIGVTGRNTARGVTGELGGKAAVRGQASGDRLALDIVGRARFSRSGRLRVAKGDRGSDLPLGAGVAGASTRVLASLQTPVTIAELGGLPGNRVTVARVDDAGTLHISLWNKANQDCWVAWVLLE